MDIFEARLSKKLERDLTKVPKHIVVNLMDWVDDIRSYGLRQVKKMSGYHDEPVHGKERKGQHSIRLSKGWRAFYIIDETNTVHCIEIIEVNHHEY